MYRLQLGRWMLLWLLGSAKKEKKAEKSEYELADFSSKKPSKPSSTSCKTSFCINTDKTEKRSPASFPSVISSHACFFGVYYSPISSLSSLLTEESGSLIGYLSRRSG